MSQDQSTENTNKPSDDNPEIKEDGSGEEVAVEITKTMAITRAAPRGGVYANILETIGSTPTVRLPKLSAKYGIQPDLLAKLDYFNPASSAKDRIALSMIEALEQQGEISPGKSTIIEASSGNTAVSLAFVCAAKGYRLILTMPESVAIERRKLLKHYGAEIEITAAERGMVGAVERAQRLQQEIMEAHLLNQFENLANPEVHKITTAEEIWADTEGKIDILIAGVGTGGTITGIAQSLKQKKPDLKAYAVEPEGSPVLSGGSPGKHKIQGIGAGFIPKVYDEKLIDEILKVSDEDALSVARELAKIEGVAAGISSGAVVSAALECAKQPENAGKQILVLLPSFCERYIASDLFEK